MGSTFNPQILVDKLMKLNSSQASIETLSHWCIFHMYKSRQVVDTWAKQFHCAPREQRLSFLYLANDILQNSRRKGSDFVGEFWKVLPDALRNVIQNGDEFARASAMRLIHIWDDRKVFGSQGQLLKEEFTGRNVENNNRNGRDSGHKLRQNAGNTLDKIVTCYQIVYGGPVDDEAVLIKCQNTVGFFDQLEKEAGSDNNSEKIHDQAFLEEILGQSAMLRNCVDQLTAVESSRARLVAKLRDALQEQEVKLDQVRNQLKIALSRSEQAHQLYDQFLKGNGNGNAGLHLVDQSLKDGQSYRAPAERDQAAPVMYSRQVSAVSEEDSRKSAAAEVAAKLTASTSSAQMLSLVLSSLASEGVIGQKGEDPSAEKRQKLEADHQSSAYAPALPVNSPQPPPPPASAYPQSESLQNDTSSPQPPTSAPPMPPPPPMGTYPMIPPPPFLHPPGLPNGLPYYNMTPLQPPLPPPSLSSYAPISTSSLPSFPPQPPPSGSYPGFSGSDSSIYSQTPSVPTAPISRQ